LEREDVEVEANAVLKNCLVEPLRVVIEDVPRRERKTRCD
jgi:hypothetical protein